MAEKSLSGAEPYTRFQNIDFLTFDEILTLPEKPSPSGTLGDKLKKLWTAPIISNEAYYDGARAIKPVVPLLGPILRVASWNIEKSMNIGRAIELLTSKEAFEKMVRTEEIKPDSEEYKEILRQRGRLVQADVLILQEMEIGLKRSNYLDAAREIAKSLNMNYVYAPQFLEIDPVLLGLEPIALEEGGDDKEAMDYYRADHEKYKGLFGSAVLSRYPIKSAVIFPLKHQAYDWYEGEKKKIGFLEKSRRLGSKTIFNNEMTRELKVGGRGFFRVDLDVPELPEGTLTVINVHLEIKCQPEGRARQMHELLSYIRDIKNPLIMMGDFNAAPTDISPTSVGRTVKRTAKNPTTWLGLAVNAVTPHGLVINTSRGVSNVTKNFNDPFAADVKVVAPNALKPMFSLIRNFQFNDGYTFDFRGNAARSIGKKDERLANSNQRGFKGFKTTFSVKRALGVVGKYRLDWVFVKAYTATAESGTWPYRFAPHFGETLEEMNTGLIEPVSDHHPNVVDLPFEEPRL
ncbi:MAG: hypothetical protein A2Z83_00150 [Omnitrophica bacterium GWA2_52_8]|nr:MAG: hypothetical protein A2Z83_00150 [Omnitrophica bacterium GWA2_52_8]